MLSRLFLAATLTIGLSASLEAQVQPNQPHRGQQPGREQMQQMQQRPQPTEIQGTVEEVVRGGIVVLDTTSQRRQVVVPANAKVKVTGGASADYLQEGVFIEFQGEIDLHGNLKEKIGELTIVTLSPERQVGLFSPESGKAGDEAGPGGKPVKPKKAIATVAGSYRIVGKLLVGRNGKLSVQTGRGTLPLELTEQPIITVDVNDYSLATKGDKITVKGLMMPNMAGRAQAVDVKIELAEPLAGAMKKKGSPAKSDAKKAAKHSKKDKDEGLPEPVDDK